MGTGGVGPQGALVGRRAVAAWARDRDVGEGRATCGAVLGVWGGRLEGFVAVVCVGAAGDGVAPGFLPAPGGAPWLPC